PTTQAPAPAASGSAATTTGAAPAAGAGQTGSTPSTAADGRSAVALNNAGFAMLPGDPQGALPLLSRAVQQFRAQGDTSSIDYVYSLYNYGWALRLAGRPAEAIPYLQERLRISSYKRGVVAKELQTAQAAAGVAPTGAGDATSPGKAKGKGKDKAGKGAGTGGTAGD
ncbi:MAG: serine/threonine protein kinase, partial [Conexibacter sp.]|nr:serine/threonine protein kinase [Conexibacter sp.]